MGGESGGGGGERELGGWVVGVDGEEGEIYRGGGELVGGGRVGGQ